MLNAQYDYYISGPMSGYADHNFPAFFRYAEKLQGQGFSVFNPATLGVEPNFAWEDYLCRDLPFVCQAKKVAVMRGWQKSRGARLEVMVARALNKPIEDIDTLQPWGTPPSLWQGDIIGLWGPAKCGKDTICSLLGWPRAAFADELKADMELFLLHHTNGNITPEMKETLRELFVAAGRVGRALQLDAWINRVFLPPERVCLTDVRYLNEMQYIWGKGGMVFEIVRPGFGPANHEEERSFAEARAYIAAHQIEVPVIYNDFEGNPARAADDIRHITQQHYLRAA